MTTLADIQAFVGTEPDGKWGPNTAAAIARALGMGPKATALADPAAFFAGVRGPLFAGSIDQSQVEGINAKLKAMGDAGWSIAWTADGLATSYWETAQKMQPVREAFWKDEAWRKANLRYWPWYGRGDVQTTWEANYRRADEELGLGGTLIENPDRMLEPEISAQTLVRGMAEGWFTGKKLADYLPGPCGTLDQFKAARAIVNGHDKDAEIAAIAITFQDALAAGGWG